MWWIASFELPGWAWILVASLLAFLVARLHEFATELADGLFDVQFRRAESRLEEVAGEIELGDSFTEIERLLVDEPLRTLVLASAALFRDEGGMFRRHVSAGWDASATDVLDPTTLLRNARRRGAAYRIDSGALADVTLPDGLGRPQIAVPVGNSRRFFAIALYGGHEAGTDLDKRERDLLASLARQAEIAYAYLEAETLRQRIAALESRLAKFNAA